VMERNRIPRGCGWSSRFLPAREFRSSQEKDARCGQGRGVQRLANVANRFLSAGVAVQEAAARREVDKRQAEERRAVTLERARAQRSALRIHAVARLHPPRRIGNRNRLRGCFRGMANATGP